jgi:phosphotriesterase-related protein
MDSVPSALKGNIQTVLGPISPDQLGITLSHEHCLLDLSCLFNEPKEPKLKKLAFDKVSWENIGYIRYHVLDNLDNLHLLDENKAIDELSLFRQYGGRSVVDHTNVDLGRDPMALVRVSRATGLNVIMGCGYYIKDAQNQDLMKNRSEEDIAEEMTYEINHGVGDSAIKAGLIGEIGTSWPLDPSELKILRSAAWAQRKTGAPLSIHPGRFEYAPKEIIKILKEEGADLNHTVIDHIDRTVHEAVNRYEIAEEGCYLAYDLWGNEGYYPETLSVTDIPNDAMRIAQIKDLIKRGFGDQIILSHDICNKSRYREYGGHGYAHILENAVPAMKRRGLKEEQILNFLVDNPARFFIIR